MAEVTLFLQFVFKRTPVKEKVVQDLLWYDSREKNISKRLKKFRGGRLVHRYDQKTKSPTVEVADLERTVYKSKSNEEQIKEWIKDHSGRYGVEINEQESSNKGVAIDFDRSLLDIIEHSLLRHGIEYEQVQ
jgi:hypothetical protein